MILCGIRLTKDRNEFTMNQILPSAQRPGRLDALTYALLPLAFFGSAFLNCAAFVLDGHRHELFRMLFVLAVQGIGALFALLKVFSLVKQKGRDRRAILAAVWILAVFGILYLWALFTLPDKTAILKNAVVQGCYLVFSCCAVLIVYCDRRLREFLQVCRIYALLWAPMVLYYCIRFYLPSAEYGVSDLGVLSAMPLSYGYLCVCLFLILDLIFFGQEMKPALRRGLLLLYGLYCIAITLAECKGSILCLVWCGLLACLVSRDSLGFFRRHLAFPAVSLVCILLFSTLLYPNYGVENRFVAFLGELRGGNQVTVSNEEIQETQDILNRVTPGQPGEKPSQEEPSQNEQPSQHGSVVDYVKSGKADEDLAAGVITEEEYNAVQEMKTKLNNTNSGGRLYLWRCALNEIEAAPLTGHGPMAYQAKYETYPHNLFLELAADFGLPAMLAVLFFGLYVLFRLLRLSRDSLYIRAFAFYVFALIPQHMLSGSLYDFSVFFQYGFCILLFVLCRKRKTAAGAA